MVTKNKIELDLSRIESRLDDLINELNNYKRDIKFIRMDYNKEEMIQYYRDQGISYQKIADILEMPVSSVYNKAKKMGLTGGNYDRG